MQKLIQDLGIDEQFTKVHHRKESFNQVKNSIRHEPDYNYMADILMLPETKQGYKYLLLVVDLYTDEFDGVAMKTKTSEETVIAVKKIFKSKKYLEKPMTLQTDGGTEFKKDFAKYLYEQNILHNITLPGRHKQNSSIESLNRQIGRLLNGYMNQQEMETGKRCREWTDILPDVIKKYNAYRKERRGSLDEENNPYINKIGPLKRPKYKIGDIVHEKLDTPEDALGHKQNTEKFREGDRRYSKVSKRIIKVIVMNDEPYYRYILHGMRNVSYGEKELMISKDVTEKYVVKKILAKRKIKNKIEYLIHWKGELKKDATWESREQLIEDGLDTLINFYEHVS